MNDIAIDGLLSKSDLDSNVEHHLSTTKIEKKIINPINLLTEKGILSFKMGTKYE